MKTALFLSILLIAVAVALFSALLALVISPLLFFPAIFAGTGGKLAVTVALLGIMLSGIVPHLIRVRFFHHPLTIAELSIAFLFALATPFVFLTALREFSIALAGAELSSSFSTFVLLVGIPCTLLGAVGSAVVVARYVQ